MDERIAYIHSQLSATIQLLNEIDANLKKTILRVADTISKSIMQGGMVLVCGNGGSAADAQHFAAEMVGRLQRNRRALPALALTTDTSILTAVGNDFSFDAVFQRQVEALGSPGDILFAISTSGNSQNVIWAVEAAKKKGMITIGLLGKGGGKLAKQTDDAIIVPHDNAQQIQEVHIVIIHILCALIETTIIPE